MARFSSSATVIPGWAYTETEMSGKISWLNLDSRIPPSQKGRRYAGFCDVSLTYLMSVKAFKAQPYTIRRGQVGLGSSPIIKWFLYSSKQDRWYCLDDIVTSVGSAGQTPVIVGLWDNDQGAIPVDDPSGFNAVNNPLIFIGRTVPL